MGYNPDHDFNLNARDIIAAQAPIPNLSPDMLARHFKIPVEKIDFMKHPQLYIAQWRYAYADAVLRVRGQE